jgi:hypothetical protein
MSDTYKQWLVKQLATNGRESAEQPELTAAEYTAQVCRLVVDTLLMTREGLK